MKKKVMAVAVAGVLAAPALAFAQASTVQIYGYLNAEYGFARGVDKAAGKTNTWDGLNSSASYIGFKGEEKLGGGMSAFFQCETDTGFLKGDQGATAAATATLPAVAGHSATGNTWCGRNSAVGLKGGWGSFYIGSWDSPTKRAVGATRIMGETGWHGVQPFLISNGGAFTGTFSARNSNSINYDSPNWNGFSFALQTTSTKEASTVTTAGLKGRANSGSVSYASGPMLVVGSYTAQDDTYVWGPAKIGLTYAKGSADLSLTSEVKRTSWNLAGTYDLGGPHSLIAGYTKAGDAKFSGTGAPTTTMGNDTGAKLWAIGYQYALSKRTTAGVTYLHASNDTNATGYSVGNNHATGLVAGSSSSVIVTRLQHTF
jgi:predicted porin